MPKKTVKAPKAKASVQSTEPCEICRIKPAEFKITTKKDVSLVVCADDKAAMDKKVGLKKSVSL